ncbi:MAG: Nramp family divalent metal transporter [Candidatus Paceibacterota bacterium]|jgi:NRAMP (natural resistance-associated macrophage protein)-like metal ion transporter
MDTSENKNSDARNSFGDGLAPRPPSSEDLVKEVSGATSTIKKETLLEEGEDYIKKLGPGIITGAADDDPSGIATYSQAGAQFGPNLLWLSVWTLPLIITVQEMCARIALVTGNGLAANIKHSYKKELLYFVTIVLLIANIFNIGANLGAMATAFQLITPGVSFTFLIIAIGIVCLTLPVIIPYKKYARYLKWLVITLFSYIITGFIIHMDWGNLLDHSLIPHITFSKSQILLITAILGTTISPYLFFWETSQEVEEEIAEGKTTVHSRRGTNKIEIKKMRRDIWTGMFLSNLVMFFIIAVCANTLFVNGVHDIDTASDAALALLPFAGSFATVLFAIGIIGTGMLAVPVLASSTSYAISESFGWKEGLYRRFKKARAFYTIIIISILIGILINFIGIHPIKALIYSAITNGIISPIILIFIVHISSNEKIMGYHKNSKSQKIVGWLTIGLMSITAIAAIISLF